MALSNPLHGHENTAFTQLVAKAEAGRINNLPYGGEVTAQEAFAYLSTHDDGLLVDVRTLPEWQAGLPDPAPGKLLTISWKTSPDYTLNPQFAAQLAAGAAAKNTPLFFLCRSGGRSLDAALAMTAAGYGYCFNVTGGFEGTVDGRAQAQGWKAANLPWKQG